MIYGLAMGLGFATIEGFMMDDSFLLSKQMILCRSECTDFYYRLSYKKESCMGKTVVQFDCLIRPNRFFLN